MRPHKGESQSDFMGRCVSDMMGDGKREQDQAVAACLNIWRETGHEAPPPPPKALTKDCTPGDDEDHETFMQRCQDEGGDEEECQLAWEERRLDPDRVVHKAHVSDSTGFEFILSDESTDRLGDVIVANGWDVKHFNRNPVALFNHSPDAVIGRWKNVGISKDGKELRGHLELAPKGISPRIDEIRALVEHGILRAVSVGFRALEHEPIKSADGHFNGFRFNRAELVECSLVSVPANPNALSVMKQLKISATTRELVLAKSGITGPRAPNGGPTGKLANHNGNQRRRAMPMLAQKIQDLETQIVAKQDELEAHLAKMDNDNVSDADIETTRTLNSDLARLRSLRDAYVESEKSLGHSTANGGGDSGHSRALSLPGAFTAGDGGGGGKTPGSAAVIVNRKKELDPIEYLVRSGVCVYQAKVQNRSLDEVRHRIYGDDAETKLALELITRAASAPAMTTVVGWAAELVQQRYEGLMELLMPQAIFTRLSAKGLTLNFGRAGKIIIPTRSRTPTIAGSFVGEGQAIPVRQGAFTTQTLVPKKLAVITSWTREMADHSIPAIEGVLREAIQQDTSVAIDTVLLDSNAATAVRPAGLLSGVSAITATAAGGINAFIGDISLLVGTLVKNLYGNVRTPVLLLNPTDILAASFLHEAGIFPFKAELAGGRVVNIPVIDSTTVPAKTMILVDAADFVSVGGDGPRMEVSDQATLHFEDTSPADLVSGSPGVVATPQKSLWQTDSLALRMIMPLNWLNRRAGTVAWIQNVTWSVTIP